MIVYKFIYLFIYLQMFYFQHNLKKNKYSQKSK